MLGVGEVGFLVCCGYLLLHHAHRSMTHHILIVFSSPHFYMHTLARTVVRCNGSLLSFGFLFSYSLHCPVSDILQPRSVLLLFDSVNLLYSESMLSRCLS